LLARPSPGRLSLDGDPPIGICGGHTTFSTFSLDACYLMERGQILASFAYMVASVILAVGASIAALRFVRAVT
jgi:fluoride exporter